MKKLSYLMLIVCFVFASLTSLAGCFNDAEKNKKGTVIEENDTLETSEYSAILIATYNDIFDEGSLSERESILVLDVSSFEEEDINVFIEYVSNKFKENPEIFYLVTKSNKDTHLRELLGDENGSVEGTLLFWYFQTDYYGQPVSYTSRTATVFVDVTFINAIGGFGDKFELEKSGEAWEVINAEMTWIE